MKKCLYCGREQSDEANFCNGCGSGLLSPEETERILNEREKQRIESENRKKEELIKRKCTVSFLLSILGLMFDFVYGVGFILSAVGLIMGLKGYIINRKTCFLWPVFLSAAGTLFGMFYFYLMFIV